MPPKEFAVLYGGVDSIFMNKADVVYAVEVLLVQKVLSIGTSEAEVVADKALKSFLASSSAENDVKQ